MSDENKQGEAATKSELSEEDLDSVAGGMVVGGNTIGDILRRVSREIPGGTTAPTTPTGQTPGQQATEGMTPSQLESTKT